MSTSSVRRVVLAAALLVSGCSARAASGGAAVADQGAQRACAGLQELVNARTAGTLGAAGLRAKLGQVYNDALTSANPVLRARAVSLFADATTMATGGQAPTLSADLQAMTDACEGLTS